MRKRCERSDVFVLFDLYWNDVFSELSAFDVELIIMDTALGFLRFLAEGAVWKGE